MKRISFLLLGTLFLLAISSCGRTDREEAEFVEENLTIEQGTIIDKHVVRDKSCRGGKCHTVYIHVITIRDTVEVDDEYYQVDRECPISENVFDQLDVGDYITIQTE